MRSGLSGWVTQVNRPLLDERHSNGEDPSAYAFAEVKNGIDRFLKSVSRFFASQSPYSERKTRNARKGSLN